MCGLKKLEMTRMSALLKRNKTMIILSVLSFYIGSAITLSFMRLDCADASTNKQESKQFNKVEYAVLVITGPDNEIRRNAIRSTWAKFANNIYIENDKKLYKWNHTQAAITQNFIKFFFIIGTSGLSENKLQQINVENNKYNDVVLLDNLVDGYKNLTKKMLYSMKWFSENTKSLKYVIKCDDDSFVRVDLIVKNLELYAPKMNSQNIKKYISFKKELSSYKGLYWGYFDGRAKGFKKGKWEEIDWFLCDRYLPYALGGGYVISRNIVDYIARNVESLSIYSSEDVSMGVWTAALDAVNRVHDIRFDTEWTSRGCNNSMLVRHKQTPDNMYIMYTKLIQSKGETLCKSEAAKRKSYMYDWDVLPSMCCAK